MTSILPRRRVVFPGLIDWLDNPWLFGERNAMRLEENVTKDAYVLRAELPGFDPGEHIHVTAEAGMLTITAEREADPEGPEHSEFRYGTFCRSVSLPERADTAKISARYVDGILEVTVPIEQPGKPVEIKVGKG
ncbi:Hsp20/alpha crystallin family protein [Amycolatopsis cynarae]|uniref:Hsp20/alpha crystallin family protein n=1 Tax=Amycolatopsis cynarae TaxID=2995223 RepID=A0ABY7B802_9PSEU|nr:Hsp20/alpha crystallin family protein [Amycolatopsis sp. HUAS 11-8]WAL68475.1 Hsp20/alpha crystallin family protein [Amycolatopsis sp. HUAS 11-8]